MGQRVPVEVMQRAVDGCPDAFDELYIQFRRAVRVAAVRILQDEHEAEDVTQETFLIALQGIQRLKDARAFPNWLLRIAHNLAVDRARRYRRCPPGPRVHDERLDSASSLPRVVRRSGAAEPSPASVALLRAEFDSLSPSVRETVQMRYRTGLSCRVIARRQGLSLSCVKTRLHRARQRLRDAVRTGGR